VAGLFLTSSSPDSTADGELTIISRGLDDRHRSASTS
jgi:hypothetical protein